MKIKEERRLLTPEDFKAPATELAPALIGKILCRELDGEILRLRITETECYFGEEDSACHAHRGRTPRTEVLYRQGGCAYVYLCYGIHYLLNFVTGEAGHPEAVLIRGVEEAPGPGRVTKRLAVDKSFNTMLLIPENRLWVEDDGMKAGYVCDRRVGIDYAAPADRDRLWRYLLKT